MARLRPVTPPGTESVSNSSTSLTTNSAPLWKVSKSTLLLLIAISARSAAIPCCCSWAITWSSDCDFHGLFGFSTTSSRAVEEWLAKVSYSHLANVLSWLRSTLSGLSSAESFCCSASGSH
ncbi:hypothetical protein D3C85_1376440 [compost metagenome]